MREDVNYVPISFVDKLTPILVFLRPQAIDDMLEPIWLKPKDLLLGSIFGCEIQRDRQADEVDIANVRVDGIVCESKFAEVPSEIDVRIRRV